MTTHLYDITEAEVGFEVTVTGVGEDEGTVAVCVKIFQPRVPCPVSFPFELIIEASDGTAGICHQNP